MCVREIAQFTHISLSPGRGRASLNLINLYFVSWPKIRYRFNAIRLETHISHKLYFFLQIASFNPECQSTMIFLQTTNVVIMYMHHS